MDIIELIIKIIITFAFGASIGSFINCLVWRRNNNMRVAKGRSQCVHCGRTLRWYENIPLISFVALRGKCRTCGKPIPPYYFIVEFFTGILFLFVYFFLVNFNDDPLCFVRDIFFISILVIIFVEDVIYQTIEPEIVWLGALVGLIFNIFFGVPIATMALGLGIGAGFFLLQYIVSRGRWIGGGDVRLGGMMGVWLGAPLTVMAIFSAYLVGAVAGLVLLLGRKRGWGSAIPFGPFLAAATFFALFYGQPIIYWYLSWMK